MVVKIKKTSRYALRPCELQETAWIYYISLLVKHLIMYCWKTLVDWYQDKIIIATTKNISSNIVYMTKSVKRYWKKYLERCKLHEAQRIKLPEADNKKERNKVKPTKTEYQLRLPFAICVDFKNILPKQDLCRESSPKSFIIQYQHQVPCRNCIYVKCNDGQNFEPPQVNIEDDVTEKFLEQVFVPATICRQNLVNNITRKWLTQEQWREYNKATNCSICPEPFKSTDKKVRCHKYLTGEYGGPAHNACNLNYHTHTFLFNIRNYSQEVRNIHRCEGKLNINQKWIILILNKKWDGSSNSRSMRYELDLYIHPSYICSRGLFYLLTWIVQIEQLVALLYSLPLFLGLSFPRDIIDQVLSTDGCRG